MSNKIDVISYKIVWVNSNGKEQEIKQIQSHSSQEAQELQSNTLSLTVPLIYERYINGNVCHQFCNSQTGVFDLKKETIIKVYIKYSDGTDINTNTNADLWKVFIVTDYSLSLKDGLLSITAVDSSYKIFSKLWSYSYGILDGGTSTNITGSVLTDNTNTFDTNNDYYLYKTLEIYDGISWQPYLILDYDSNSITVNTVISESTGASYRIGWSTPSMFMDLLQRTTGYSNLNGNYSIDIEPTLDFGVNYIAGIQLLRNDGSAFPIIEIAEFLKPIWDWANNIIKIDATNTELEIENNNLTHQRPMVFNITNKGTNHDTVNLFYPIISGEIFDTQEITSLTQSTITLNGASYTNDELIDKIVRINGKTYGISTNTNKILTLVPATLEDDGVIATDTAVIYDKTDYIWDNTQDFKHMYDLKFSTSSNEIVNTIYYTAGTNVLNNEEILGFEFNEDTDKTMIVSKQLSLIDIAKNLLEDDDRKQSNGTFAYPSYPYTTYWGVVVTSDTTYNTAFREHCKLIARQKARNYFSLTKDKQKQMDVTLRGNRSFNIITSDNFAKFYNKGQSIIYKDAKNGLINTNYKDGYFRFRIDNINHSIQNGEWTTRLVLKEDVDDVDQDIRS